MRISVNADNREYSVQIGPGMIKEEGLFTGFRRAAVVTDETVAKLHLDTIMATLERAKVRAGSIILPPGEEIKSRDRLFDIYSGLMDNLIGRSDAVIAFGGGTVGDAAGFAAATYRRGVPLVHCPTTLLAQAGFLHRGKGGHRPSPGQKPHRHILPASTGGDRYSPPFHTAQGAPRLRHG
mgnify:CR=1 FL=1